MDDEPVTEISPAADETALAAAIAALEALRARHAEVVAERDRALEDLVVLATAVQERNEVIAALRADAEDRERRVEDLNARLERTLVRVDEVEQALARTLETQRVLEADFDEVRRTQEQIAASIAAVREADQRSQADLADRDDVVRRLQAEMARRGTAGSPAAVRTALADFFKDANRRRLERLAATQPWRLPPGRR